MLKQTEKIRFACYGAAAAILLLTMMVCILGEVTASAWVTDLIFGICLLLVLAGQAARMAELRREKKPVWANVVFCCGLVLSFAGSCIS
ncbi:MAG: hypothetical protein ACI3W8_08065 [Oscillospiraceae bacterium]